MGEPPVRPEYEIDLKPFNHEADIDTALEKKLSLAQRLWRIDGIRKTCILLVLALVWEVAARVTDNDLLLPTFVQTFDAFVAGIANGNHSALGDSALSKSWGLEITFRRSFIH